MKIESKNISVMIEAAQPGAAIKRHCKFDDKTLLIGHRSFHLNQYKNLYILGTGKATASMAKAIEDMIDEKITGGIITVKFDHVADLKHINLMEAAHPVPDENGVRGASAILNLAKCAKEDGLTLKDKQDIIKILFSCGATIHEINTIRKHISKIKGGRLAKAVYPATLITLMLSDVVGDDLDVIASGPTVPDSSSFYDCMNIFLRYGIIEKIPKNILKHIESGISGEIDETPKPLDPVFEKTYNLIIGSNIESLMAAKRKAESLGYNVILLSSMIEGETRFIAQVHSAIAREIIKTGNPLPLPACILSGGETTVTISGNGLGGRNQEFALSASLDISGKENIVILSGGTDGIDGPTDAAGAFSDTFTLKRAEEMGLNPYRFLANNDSYHFFQKLGDLFITGPTNTNVMDLRIVLVT